MLSIVGRVFRNQNIMLLCLAMVILTMLIGGCTYINEKKYGHGVYPAGGGVLVDTNDVPIVVPVPTEAK